MKTYLRILAIAKSNIKYLPLFIVSTFFYSLFSVLSIAILIPVLSVIFKTEDSKPVQEFTEFPAFEVRMDYPKDVFYYYFGDYMSEGEFAALQFVCVVLLCSAFFSNVFRFTTGLIMAKVRAKIIAQMRNLIFNKITAKPLGYFTEARKGDIISRTMTDVQLVESTVVGSMKVLFKEPFQIIAYLVMLFTISVKLTLFTLILFPFSGLLIGAIAKKLKRKATSSQESLGKISNILDETLSGMRIIKAFTARGLIGEAYKKEVNRYAKLTISISKRFELAGPISEFFGYGVMVGVILIGGNMILGNESDLTAQQFIGFVGAYTQLLSPAKAISNSLTNIQRGIAAADRVFEITDSVAEAEDDKDAIKIEDLNQEISIQNMSFAYEDEKVLSDINLTVKKGQTIALVGPSGSGKSTLADLIPRFYDASEGEILIDGENIKKYSLNSLRKLMGIVTQESILFNDTIFNNIAFGQPDVTIEQVVEAAKIANAHEFISIMEEGYETNIGERGSKLSGGQKQRLSIARAVLKNPPILILDEATSALDSESEKLVQEAINNLMKNRTSIVIAHRLSTIQNADEIVVLQKGEIIQRGRHQELLAEEGMYKKLTEMQSF